MSGLRKALTVLSCLAPGVMSVAIINSLASAGVLGKLHSVMPVYAAYVLTIVYMCSPRELVYEEFVGDDLGYRLRRKPMLLWASVSIVTVVYIAVTSLCT